MLLSRPTVSVLAARRTSLSTWVLVVLCVAAVVPTVVVGALATRHATTDVEREVVRGNLALIRALGADLHGHLQDTRRAIEFAATSWAYDRAADGAAPIDDADRVATGRMLERLKRGLPLVSTLTIVDPEGRRLYGDPLPDPGEVERFTSDGLSDIFMAGERPQVLSSTQARNRTGALIGALVTTLDLAFVADTLEAQVDESRLGAGARLLVVDAEGRPVARSDRVPIAGAGSLRDAHPAVDRALRTASEGSVEAGGVLAVYSNFASYRSSLVVPWAIVLEQPVEHAYALARRTARDTLITGVAVLALSLLVGMVLAARLTRPLRQLAARAGAMFGDSDLDRAPPAPVAAPGEIGLLAQRFEDMARRVSEREQLQAALARGDRVASVGTMAATVAHEINKPLTTVLGYAKLLLEGKEPAHADRAGLELIAEEAARMKGIAGSLLRYSRNERALSMPGEMSADVNLTLEHAADLLVPLLRRLRVRVDLDLAGDLPRVAADTHSLQRVFVDLVQNAAQSMPEGGTAFVVSRMAPGDVAVHVCVTDQGPGVADEHKSQVFEPFFTTEQAGTGLAVCKHLVTRFGGTIEVSDGPDGRGARFCVVMPVAE